MLLPTASSPGPDALLGSPARLAVVEALRLSGHLGDAHLDALVRTAAQACATPVAVLNIPTPGLQTYPAEVGVGQPCTRVPDDVSFCVEVVERGRPLQVEDATAHPVYADNPLVQNGAVRAYAGHPIVYAGTLVGTLSVLDRRSRRFAEGELAALADLATVVEAMLSLRASSAWDRLTGLAGRPLLLDRVDRALVRATDAHGLVGLVVVDVQGTSEINLRYGSAVGDEVLCEVARRLAGAVGRRHSVARLGDDEFGVVLEDLASTEEARTRVAELVGLVRGPVCTAAGEVTVDVRAGTATGTDGTADALLAAAENAVRRRSERSPDADAGTTGRAQELLRAVEQGEFVLHYQPVVDLATGRPLGVEALVRWQHPQHGLLPPSQFIDDAERTGAIVPLGTAVLRAAAVQLARWHRAGRDLTVAVNLSPRQLADEGFDQHVAAVLAETGAPARSLVLEITESSVMDEPTAPATLARLRALGVHLALDDFGTGYSSLAYLRRFPVDSIKIDRSFVSGLGRDADDEAIVASVVSLAERVEKDVVAEGVETLAQAEALRQLGVRMAQGFLWTQPLPVEQLETWLAARRDVPVLPGPRRARRAPSAPPLAGSAEEQILRLHAEGASLHTIAAALNSAGSRTDRGVRWHTRSVAAVVAAAAGSTVGDLSGAG